MPGPVDELREQVESDLSNVGDVDALSALHDKYLGRKSGAIPALLKQMGKLSPDERREFGQAVNDLKNSVEAALEELRVKLEEQAEQRRLEQERLDITLPGLRPRFGHLHPITQMWQRIEAIFVSMGYTVEDGPEVETSFYNFDALNIPPGHPARQTQDTLYLRPDIALRSQTSTVQIRTMQRRRPPLRVIAPGKVFRRDTPDPTHNPIFHQVEGLTVDRRIHMGHLRGTLQEFVRRLFGAELKTRFRPSYFPFVEPGGEVDYQCFVCLGEGCRVCKGSGWIELGGCGMVHRRVLQGVGIDWEEFTGFAFGLGIDRMAALIYGIDDIRLLFENDIRFLEQFGI
ncbi:MAG: phenylalanine--tRNA ligase subunit alpha [Acidobacteria bacterium]|nr:phenylalanine--tRNA ligase subunit alpha [Acidobacteriota bacterium]